MHSIMYNVRDMGWILKSMAIYQKNSKGTIKSNFVASCLTFRGSILTRHCNIKIKGVEKNEIEDKSYK